jgi:LmbE family N-acetylglucosaminyl deacetylase
VVVVTTASVGGLLPWWPVPLPSAQAATTALTLQVVAHQDDDLLFMNPDLDDSIRAGTGAVTVFVTAGEITGNGGTPEARARTRQRGAQNAYAFMAGVADDEPRTQVEWTSEIWQVGGRNLQRYTLRQRPDVQLVFMNIPDQGIPRITAGETVQTVVPQGEPVASTGYDRAAVVSTLAEIMSTYRPTLLRTQDPLPDPRYSTDHADHIGVAQLALAASRVAPGRPVEIAYRDYGVGDLPVNLDPATAERKQQVFDQYTGVQADGTALFDTGAATSVRYPRWNRRVYPRWSRGTTWAGSDGDGRLHVLVVRDGRLLWSREDLDPADAEEPGDAGSEWAGAELLGVTGGDLAPVVSVGTDPQGWPLVVAVRLADQHVLVTSLNGSGGTWSGRWTDLGSPDAGSAAGPAIGGPVVTTTDDGRSWVLVRNGSGGVSVTSRDPAGGGWTGVWEDLGGGPDVQDGLAVVTDPAGRATLVASTRTALLRWTRGSGAGRFTGPDALPVPATGPVGPPAVAVSRDGHLEIGYRQAETGQVIVTQQVGQGWNPSPVVLGDLRGVGGPAMASTSEGSDGRITVAARSRDGVGVTRQQGPDGEYGRWVDLGGSAVDDPAVVVHSRGPVVVLAVGEDGTVRIARQTDTGSSTFTDWQDVS